ncbi:MAG: nucleotidyltransferase domain-containing protein [Nitrospinae bacterium]|nr:nucleotidyltransferase domain-containing protein [Nitrospinota bacterium]
MKSIDGMTLEDLKSWKPERAEFSEIRQMAVEIAKAFNPHKIILFGSYARGDATAESDVDLLVIMDSDDSPPRRSVGMYRLLNDYVTPVEILVRTPAEVESYKNASFSVIHAALREGITLYER